MGGKNEYMDLHICDFSADYPKPEKIPTKKDPNYRNLVESCQRRETIGFWGPTWSTHPMTCKWSRNIVSKPPKSGWSIVINGL